MGPPFRTKDLGKRASPNERLSVISQNVIPDDVAQFILDKIDSVAQMEALLLLRSDPREEWNLVSLAKRLYISEADTADILTRLCSDGFVASITTEPPLYRYQPSSTDLRVMVDRMAEVYSKHLVPVTNLIHTKPKTRVQEFADAFRLRKDK
jgi:hypothetical protein